ncbi:MAG: hypothetical protein DMF11_08005 [Verrucomicrobia bacterium]|nr:MAG: hypothetical protein DMF11_08005 [Verrucomicrobiota bacterium]
MNWRPRVYGPVTEQTDWSRAKIHAPPVRSQAGAQIAKEIPNAVRSLRTVAAKSIIWRHGAPLVATALCAVLAS